MSCNRSIQTAAAAGRAGGLPASQVRAGARGRAFTLGDDLSRATRRTARELSLLLGTRSRACDIRTAQDVLAAVARRRPAPLHDVYGRPAVPPPGNTGCVSEHLYRAANALQLLLSEQALPASICAAIRALRPADACTLVAAAAGAMGDRHIWDVHDWLLRVRGALDPTAAALSPIERLQWPRRRKRLGYGGYAVAYRVAPRIVAKVGRVAAEEAQLQQHYAAQGKALPVLDYQSQVDVPRSVARDVCAVHGVRRAMVAPGCEECLCRECPDVLLMPEAEECPHGMERAALDLMEQVGEDMLATFGRGFDVRLANAALYQGHLVALDFGETDG